MKLKKARVKLYRNIVDSDDLVVDDSVTCLVGKNESGKTALLMALYSLNPAYDNLIDIDVNLDYPRWRMIRDGKDNVLEEVEYVEAHFSLADEEIDDFNEFMGFKIPVSEIQVSRTYGNRLKAIFNVSEVEWIKALLEAEIIGKGIKNKISELNTFSELLSKLEELKLEIQGKLEDLKEEVHEEEVSDDATEGAIENETVDLEQSEDNESLEKMEVYNRDLEELESIINTVQRTFNVFTDPSFDEFINKIEGYLPEFFYYSSYNRLEGRTDLNLIVWKVKSGEDLNEYEQTVLALLNLAGVEGQDLLEDEYEQRVALLEAAASEITQQVLEYWTQNDDLRVKFDIDSEDEETRDGKRVVRRYLEVRLDDLKHHVTTNFSTRSTGFQWFFSFLAAFSDFSDRDDVIILLDEPGLGLHAKAQGDLLRYINDNLGDGRQVIYTHHSPFMVDPKKLERVRLVEDLTTRDDPGIGSKISENVLSVKSDTRFPLQAALGYDIAQNIFVGGYNLIVEGPSDLLYLNVLSEYLGENDKTSLNHKITIVPVGGADKIPTFIAILGAHVDVSVLVDANMGNDQRIDDMLNDGILKEDRLISVGKIKGNSSDNIEDLFTDDEYLKLYNEAFQTNITPADILGDASIIKRIENKIGHKFNHYKPSWVLQTNPGHLDQLSPETIKNFDKLIDTLNKSF